MSITGERYIVAFDALDQQVNFEGTLRTQNRVDLKALRDYLVSIYDRLDGSMRLNFRKLRYINSAALKTIVDFLQYAKQRDRITIKLIGSKVITWEVKTLPALPRLWRGIEFVLYDDHFYESQGIIEDVAFIPLLRNQTRLLWPLEKEVLVRHGLRPGLRMADICCGCGDVALLIAKELNPAIMVGVDHSRPAIEYARKLQGEFKVKNVDFRLGDATALMLEDEIFDFVICRLSIQIFSKPELILKELARILRPGGRMYLLGEDYDLIVGYPNEQEIRRVYDRAGRYGTDIGMDLYNGKKLYSILTGLKLTNILLDYISVDTVNSDRRLFAEMIASWRHFSAETIGRKLSISKEDHDQLLAGYDAHLQTIRHPFGFTKWTLVSASGEKGK
jgi:SAM-dependent methyltransferase/anti-anti-sigma regulatory factor